MFASGVPTAEKPTAKKYYLLSHDPSDSPAAPHNPEFPDAWKKYQSYLASTSILIPIPPFLYRLLPTFIKKTILLDFPMYEFSEDDKKNAIEEAMNKPHGQNE